MNLTEEKIKDLEYNFQQAKNQLTGNKPSSVSKQQEQNYGRAYQALYKAGLRPKLKKKYHIGC